MDSLIIYFSPSQWVYEILSSQVDGTLTRWETLRLQLTLQEQRGRNIKMFRNVTGSVNYPPSTFISLYVSVCTVCTYWISRRNQHEGLINFFSLSNLSPSNHQASAPVWCFVNSDESTGPKMSFRFALLLCINFRSYPCYLPWTRLAGYQCHLMTFVPK